MNINNLKAKISNAQLNTPKQTSTVTVPAWNMFMKDTNKQDFDKVLINLSEILSEKLQYVLHGKPYIVEHKTDKEIGQFVDKLELQEVMFHNEKILFDKGASYIIIEKIGAGSKAKIQLRIAEPSFPNTVTRLGSVKIAAEVWSAFKFDRVKYYQQTIYTHDSISNNIYADKADAGFEIATSKEPTNLDKFNKKLSPNMQIQGTLKNTLGFIPVVEVQYKPTRDFSWAGRDAIAPAKRIESQQAFLNDGTRALLLELYLNRTKIIVDADMLDGADKDELRKIADENIIGVLKDSGGSDGMGQKQMEIIQGDPKITEYWENINNIISLAIAGLKLSELSESESASTATGAIFNKGNDVETANTLQVFRQRAISEIIAKSLAIRDGIAFEEYELDTSDISVQLIPNVIMNESKMTDMVIKQLNAGLISDVQAKVKLEGISKVDAENSLAEVKKQEEMNPEMNPEVKKEIDGQTGNPRPEAGE